MVPHQRNLTALMAATQPLHDVRVHPRCFSLHIVELTPRRRAPVASDFRLAPAGLFDLHVMLRRGSKALSRSAQRRCQQDVDAVHALIIVATIVIFFGWYPWNGLLSGLVLIYRSVAWRPIGLLSGGQREGSGPSRASYPPLIPTHS
jgi:hypothetical protein